MSIRFVSVLLSLVILIVFVPAGLSDEPKDNEPTFSYEGFCVHGSSAYPTAHQYYLIYNPLDTAIKVTGTITVFDSNGNSILIDDIDSYFDCTPKVIPAKAYGIIDISRDLTVSISDTSTLTCECTLGYNTDVDQSGYEVYCECTLENPISDYTLSDLDISGSITNSTDSDISGNVTVYYIILDAEENIIYADEYSIGRCALKPDNAFNFIANWALIDNNSIMEHNPDSIIAFAFVEP